MPPITPADTLACLKQAFDEFTNSHVRKRPTPTIVADLGTLLFEQRIADAEAAVKGETRPVRIFRVSEVIDTLKAKRNQELEKSFSGNKRMQVDLAAKLDKLRSYRTADGKLLRVFGPEHRRGTEVHLYLDVVEAEIEEITTDGTKVVRSLSPATAQIVDAFNRLPASERKAYDEAAKQGRVQIGRMRFGKGKRPAFFAMWLLLTGLAAFGGYVVHRYVESRRHEEPPPQPVGSAIEVTPPFRLDELRKVRFTPAMHYNVRSAGMSDECTAAGMLAPLVYWEFDETLEPPFVLLRNNEVYLDQLTARKQNFTDHGASPGLTYTYAVGKRNEKTGDIDVNVISSGSVGKCGKRNRPPIVGIFPDPPGGTAPLTITFDAMYVDDKPEQGATFSWLFGDDSMANTRTRRVTHEYKYGGEYEVSLSVLDSEGGIDNASLHLSLAGPPAPATPPPQEPERFWRGEDWAYVSKIRARTGEDILLRATPKPIPSGANPVAYRWAFGDCVEEAMPGNPRSAELRDRNCITDPLTTPDFRKRFEQSGLFAVMLEITYDTGETAHRHLGSISVRPSEADYAKRPELRVWYSEPAPTPSDWDRAATPRGTYR